MKFREHTEQATGWIDSTIIRQINDLGALPWVDRKRVTEAMVPGWRYREEEGVPPERLLGALQTSAWFNVDAEAVGGMMGGADPLADELPPLPFPRIAIDAQWQGHRAPLLGVTLRREGSVSTGPPDKWMMLDPILDPDELVPPDPDSVTLGIGSMVLFEIQQGLLWDCFVSSAYLDQRLRDHNMEILGYHLTYNQHTSDYEGWRKYSMFGWGEDEKEGVIEFDRQFGHLVWKTAVTCAHMLTATNVRNVRVLPRRKQMRAWDRQRYRPIEPRIYRVNIMSTNEVRTSGATDREYHCRWMVRGHYRRTAHGEYRHPSDGSPASWVRAHVKGPAGAPWKGRPYHIREGAV